MHIDMNKDKSEIDAIFRELTEHSEEDFPSALCSMPIVSRALLPSVIAIVCLLLAGDVATWIAFAVIAVSIVFGLGWSFAYDNKNN